MSRRLLAAIVVAAIAVSCRDPGRPPAQAAANLVILTDLAETGLAGSTAGAFTVRVTDADGQPLSNVLVQFAPSIGAVRADPQRALTSDDGSASTTVTLSTTPGPNQVAALVAGVGQVRSATVTGAPGEADTISFSPRILWFQPDIDRRSASAVVRDQLGNVLPGAVTWTSRDPALVAVATSSGSSAELQVVGRPGATYLVASQGAAVDSVLVAVHDSTSSPCDFLTAPVDLPVGASLSFETAGIACVRAPSAAEYFVIAHYNTAVASASAGIGVAAHNITNTGAALRLGSMRGSAHLFDSLSFEGALRARERAGMAAHVDVARDWYDARAAVRSLALAPRVGDIMSLNVNSNDFCDKPKLRDARVVTLSQEAIILADTSNPAGGFTDEEYESFARTVDTLVMPVDREAFGEHTDIDGNGRVAILFTRAVNELSPRGAATIVLGFFYSRDLLPRTGITGGGACPGSNAGEMFYVMVPDPDGAAGDARSREYVKGVAIGTIAHELQHLINASRRAYVTRTPQAVEETWLNEGLSHIAEELVFYRASGLTPRQNIGGSALAPGTQARAMHDLLMNGNFGRFRQFLIAPFSNSPLAANDQLATRGASWAFLRYVADRAGATDGDLWRRLVDGRHVGVSNLDDAIAGTGMTALGALAEWTQAVAVDELVGASNPALAQPSWDFATALPAVGYDDAGPEVFALSDGQSTSLPLRSGGSAYFTIGVDAGREALVLVSTGGGVAQPGMRLTVVRTR